MIGVTNEQRVALAIATGWLNDYVERQEEKPTTEELLKVAMEHVKEEDWLLRSDDDRFVIAVLSVTDSISEEDNDILIKELTLLRDLSMALTMGSGGAMLGIVDRLTDDEDEPIKFFKIKDMWLDMIKEKDEA